MRRFQGEMERRDVNQTGREYSCVSGRSPQGLSHTERGSACASIMVLDVADSRVPQLMMPDRMFQKRRCTIAEFGWHTSNLRRTCCPTLNIVIKVSSYFVASNLCEISRNADLMTQVVDNGHGSAHSQRMRSHRHGLSPNASTDQLQNIGRETLQPRDVSHGIQTDVRNR